MAPTTCGSHVAIQSVVLHGRAVTQQREATILLNAVDRIIIV